MRKINTFLLTLLLLSLTGCEDKKSTENEIPIENTTEVFTTEDKTSQADNRFKLQTSKKEKTTSHTINNASLSDTFTLQDMKNTHYTVSVSNQKVTFKESQQAIVLITFFATWCPPCLADIPYMNDLQKKYHKDLLVTGVLSHDAISQADLKSFLAKHEVKYYISNSIDNNDFAALVARTLGLSKDFSIPLTVMYVEGNYFTHYEGCVPVEMIDYDIQEALKTLK